MVGNDKIAPKTLQPERFKPLTFRQREVKDIEIDDSISCCSDRIASYISGNR